jgi:uncharacterized protein
MQQLIFIILLFISTSLVAQSTVESIPNQKLINGSYVSNPDRILDEATVHHLDTVLTSLEKKTTAQVAVVVVESIGDADIFEFAQKLFTAWVIGSKGNDNGLLVLFVNDQRTVRFHTGVKGSSETLWFRNLRKGITTQECWPDYNKWKKF